MSGKGLAAIRKINTAISWKVVEMRTVHGLGIESMPRRIRHDRAQGLPIEPQMIRPSSKMCFPVIGLEFDCLGKLAGLLESA